MLPPIHSDHIGYTIEDSGFLEVDLAPLLEHKILKNLTVSVPLSLEQWHWIDKLLGSHPNTLDLCLSASTNDILAGRPTWEDLEFLAGMKNLRSLTISDTQITDIAPVFQCAGLQSFAFMDFRQSGTLDLRGIANLLHLKSLTLSWPSEHFEEVNSLVGLESLSVSYQKKNFDISRLQNLKHLSLASVKPQANDAFLLAFPKLESLGIWGDFLGSFDAIRQMKTLHSLGISKNKKLQELEFASGLKQLQTLELYQVSNVACLPNLSGIPLKTLKINQMKRLTDMDHLRQMSSLEVLEITEIPAQPHSFWLEALNHLPNLKECRIDTGYWEETVAISKEIRSRGIQTYEIGLP